jgi:hypothetical protein
LRVALSISATLVLAASSIGPNYSASWRLPRSTVERDTL